MNISFNESKFSRQRPAPSTTHTRGARDEMDGKVGLLREPAVEAAEHAAAADEVNTVQNEVLRELGRRLRDAITASQMAPTCSSIAARTSSGTRRMVFGSPDMRSRPRTSALNSSATAAAEPIASLISSAVRSPMAMPYSPYVRLDRGVDVERADTDRLERNHAAE